MITMSREQAVLMFIDRYGDEVESKSFQDYVCPPNVTNVEAARYIETHLIMRVLPEVLRGHDLRFQFADGSEMIVSDGNYWLWDLS